MEERLVRAVPDEVGTRTGSRGRFVAVFRERYRDLYGLAYRLLGDHGEAEDVVQETFLRLDGQAVLDRPDEEVAAWLRRVCLNTAYNRLRGQRPAGPGGPGRAGRRRDRHRLDSADGRAPGRGAAGGAPGPRLPAGAATRLPAAAPRRLLLRGDRRDPRPRRRLGRGPARPRRAGVPRRLPRQRRRRPGSLRCPALTSVPCGRPSTTPPTAPPRRRCTTTCTPAPPAPTPWPSSSATPSWPPRPSP